MEQDMNTVVGPVADVHIGSPYAATQHKPSVVEDCQRHDVAPCSKDRALKASPETPTELLAQDTELLDKLSTLLKYQNPPVTDMQSASEGFQNFSQLIAAVDVSHNWGIPFGQLKTLMQTSVSLSRVIPSLKADVDGNEKCDSTEAARPEACES